MTSTVLPIRSIARRERYRVGNGVSEPVPGGTRISKQGSGICPFGPYERLVTERLVSGIAERVAGVKRAVRTGAACRFRHRYAYAEVRYDEVYAVEKTCMRCGAVELEDPRPIADPE